MEDLKISLAAARVNAKMTQDQVARELGIAKATLISWEKGRTSVPSDVLVRLCVMYGCSLNNIFLSKA